MSVCVCIHTTASSAKKKKLSMEFWGTSCSPEWHLNLCLCPITLVGWLFELQQLFRRATRGSLFAGLLWGFIVFSLCLLKKGKRNWHLTDSPAGFRVDTIKEPSDGSVGDQTSPLPTRHAAVSLGVSRVSQTMLTNPQNWGSCGFSLQSTRTLLLLLWPCRFNTRMAGPCEKYLYQ